MLVVGLVEWNGMGMVQISSGMQRGGIGAKTLSTVSHKNSNYFVFNGDFDSFAFRS